jgi:hypothetical protein
MTAFNGTSGLKIAIHQYKALSMNSYFLNYSVQFSFLHQRKDQRMNFSHIISNHLKFYKYFILNNM